MRETRLVISSLKIEMKSTYDEVSRRDTLCESGLDELIGKDDLAKFDGQVVLVAVIRTRIGQGRR